MSRRNSDKYDGQGILISGYDYDLQLWVVYRRVLNCNHPDAMNCGCLARKYAGRDIEEVRKAEGLSPVSSIYRAIRKENRRQQRRAAQKWAVI